MLSSAVEKIDGRHTRTARSRLAICEACLDLIQEGILQPSADEISDRAGVSRRSVFNHFADLAELYDAVVEAGMERCAPLLEEISAKEPVAWRIERLVDVRSNFNEATSEFTRALTVQALVGAAADQALRVSKNGQRLLCEELERLFGDVLAGLDPADRAEVYEALLAALAPLHWETLRRVRGHSVIRARGIMKRTLRSILGDAGVELRPDDD